MDNKLKHADLCLITAKRFIKAENFTVKRSPVISAQTLKKKTRLLFTRYGGL